MKFASVFLICCCLLSGCSSRENSQMEQVIDLRKTILEASNCSFLAAITVDYGNEVYTFQMNCEAGKDDTLNFSVTDPETIAGITGEISNEQAAFTFDDRVLAFPMLADDQLAPVAAPWLFIKALRSGYLTGCSKEGEGLCIYVDDSFEDNLLQLLIYTDADTVPIRAEFIYKDRRILTMDIKDFILQ